MLVGNTKDRGDTLIEVLFAISIFSLIAIGGLAIMNQGTATSQRALEITLVRQEIDAQAETLRFLNASYIAAYQPGAISYPVGTPAKQWNLMEKSIIATGAISTSPLESGSLCQTPPQGSFILDANNATFISPTIKPAQTFSQVHYISGQVTAEGIWIEAIRSPIINDNNQKNIGYIDFHIRACWDSPGQSVPVTMGTIVRLYEPR